METSEFFRKLTGKFLWLNFLAMAIVVLMLIVGVAVAMHIYTHHGEYVTIPDLRKHSYEDSRRMIYDLGMDYVVNDTGYVKELAPGTILDQLPAPGTKVKGGRTIYLTINATDTPTLIMPDIVDNCSLREAMARLSAMGFKLGETEYVAGEKDWVYGILANGRNVLSGDRVSIEAKVVIQAGNGQRDAADSIYMTDIPDDYEGDPFGAEDGELQIQEIGGSGDDFEIIE